MVTSEIVLYRHTLQCVVVDVLTLELASEIVKGSARF